MSAKKLPIALELYSVRNEAAADLFGVLEKTAKMGYDGVEFAGFHGKAAADIKKVLDDNGLAVPSCHSRIDALLDPETFLPAVEFHLTIGCPWYVIPWIPKEMRDSKENCLATSAKLTELCEKLAAHGMRLGFHAHGDDMHELPDGGTAWHYLGANTPASFIMQYDTANGMQGGADPVQPILDFPGKGASVHLKEWAGGHGAIIGEGDVPWARVFEVCESVAGTEWYVVEHEEEGDALDAVAKCLANLRGMGK
ncbi:MAG: sugar phosphate isomerase/epimerase family protein [Fimbriimonas sp.]